MDIHSGCQDLLVLLVPLPSADGCLVSFFGGLFLSLPLLLSHGEAKLKASVGRPTFLRAALAARLENMVACFLVALDFYLATLKCGEVWGGADFITIGREQNSRQSDTYGQGAEAPSQGGNP